MVQVIVCRKMLWTWQEYEAQPTFFLTILLELIQAEEKAQRKPAVE